MFVMSCSTNKGGYTNADEVSNRLVGMTISELVSIMGAPTNSIDLVKVGKRITFNCLY
jgi:outer membrane protein assembly factor BamE (lipoprotein component of BamABCDE complex)